MSTVLKPIILLALLICAALVLAGGERGEFPRRLSTLERIRIRRLRSTHDQLELLRAEHVPLPPPEGFRDLRTVIHAHSELSWDSPGTLPKLAWSARQAGVHAVMMTEHPADQHDVLARGYRGFHDGVLFIAGTEEDNLLTFPTARTHNSAKITRQQRVNAVTGQSPGLAFVAHPEEITDWSLEGYHGIEIYNVHADLKDEPELTAMLSRRLEFDDIAKLWQGYKAFPGEIFSCITDPPLETLSLWDRLLRQRRVVGIAGNDCHESLRYKFIKKSDTEVEVVDFRGTSVAVFDVQKLVPSFLPASRLLSQEQVGSHLMTATLDPYELNMKLVSTHVLAREWSEEGVREALRAGRCYVSFDWIADPTGTSLRVVGRDREAQMGEEIAWGPDLALEFATTIPVSFRIIRNGVASRIRESRSFRVPIAGPGVYRVECYVAVGPEDRPYLFTNPIYVR